MANQDIRKSIEGNNLKYWEIAYRLRMNDGNFSRKLRKELPEDEKKRIFKIVDELKNEKERS